MACLQIYLELLSLASFLRVRSNSKEASFLSCQNAYPDLKTTCHIKLKFFLWTKLLENLFLTKYLISVRATLIPDFPVSTTILNTIDISCRPCKLNSRETKLNHTFSMKGQTREDNIFTFYTWQEATWTTLFDNDLDLLLPFKRIKS